MAWAIRGSWRSATISWNPKLSDLFFQVWLKGFVEELTGMKSTDQSSQIVANDKTCFVTPGPGM
jgi:hypothetical protein